MSSQYRVRVTKDHLTFCSGHFITYEGEQCERLHGHNYKVMVEVAAPLDENRYVFDFIKLKQLTMAISDELDHRMMLPTKNRWISVQMDQRQVHVRFQEKYWSFPVDDCVLLPIENTTAEQLAQYITGRLKISLQQEAGFVPQAISVEVEESHGQSAIYAESTN